MPNPMKILKQMGRTAPIEEDLPNVCGEFIDKVLTTRNLTHIAHLTTNSYSDHKALQHLYEDIVDILDNIVELYQGKFGKIGAIVFSKTKMPKNIVSHIEAEYQWFEDNRHNIAKGVSAIKAELDVLDAAYLKAIYKLKHLK